MAGMFVWLSCSCTTTLLDLGLFKLSSLAHEKTTLSLSLHLFSPVKAVRAQQPFANPRSPVFVDQSELSQEELNKIALVLKDKKNEKIQRGLRNKALKYLHAAASVSDVCE